MSLASAICEIMCNSKNHGMTNAVSCLDCCLRNTEPSHFPGFIDISSKPMTVWYQAFSYSNPTCSKKTYEFLCMYA